MIKGTVRGLLVVLVFIIVVGGVLWLRLEKHFGQGALSNKYGFEITSEILGYHAELVNIGELERLANEVGLFDEKGIQFVDEKGELNKEVVFGTSVVLLANPEYFIKTWTWRDTAGNPFIYNGVNIKIQQNDDYLEVRLWFGPEVLWKDWKEEQIENVLSGSLVYGLYAATVSNRAGEDLNTTHELMIKATSDLHDRQAMPLIDLKSL